MIEDRYAARLAVAHPGIIHPARWLAPHGGRAFLAFGIQHRAAVLLLELIREADREAAVVTVCHDKINPGPRHDGNRAVDDVALAVSQKPKLLLDTPDDDTCGVCEIAHRGNS